MRIGISTSIGQRKTPSLRQRIRAILAKNPGSHYWDFGLPQSMLAYGATHTAAEFLAAYPNAWLFQDHAGTTPVTALEHPIGLVLDQPKGYVELGPELVTGNNATFDSGLGSWASSSSFASTAANVSGEMHVTTTASYGRQVLSLPATAGKTYRLTATSRHISGTGNALVGLSTATNGASAVAAVDNSTGSSVTGSCVLTAIAANIYVTCGVNSSAATGAVNAFDNISVQEVIGSHALQATTTKRPYLRARYNMLVGTATLSTQTVTTLAASYRLAFTGSGTVTLSGTYAGSLVAGGTLTFTATAGTLTLTVSGSVTLADLRPANSPTNLPAYQRVTTATDYDTVGFPARAVWDGVDDFLSTGSIDFTGTDKVTIVSGVGKDSDAARGMLIELGNAPATATFNVSAPDANAAATFGARSAGSIAVDSSTSSVGAPKTAVLSIASSISTDSIVTRVNASQTAASTSDQGTGNYSNNPLYIGMRAGTSLPFKGSISSLAIIPSLIPAGDLTTLEQSANASLGKVY